jgi:hypothetical protein
MADAEGEIQLVEGDGADTNAITDEEEEMHKQRVTWVKAVLGELLCTTLFLFIVMAAGVSFARSQELRRVEATNPVVAAISTGFCAVALIYSFADVSGAHFNVRCRHAPLFFPHFCFFFFPLPLSSFPLRSHLFYTFDSQIYLMRYFPTAKRSRSCCLRSIYLYPFFLPL